MRAVHRPAHALLALLILAGCHQQALSPEAQRYCDDVAALSASLQRWGGGGADPASAAQEFRERSGALQGDAFRLSTRHDNRRIQADLRILRPLRSFVETLETEDGDPTVTLEALDLAIRRSGCP